MKITQLSINIRTDKNTSTYTNGMLHSNVN